MGACGVWTEEEHEEDQLVNQSLPQSIKIGASDN